MEQGLAGGLARLVWRARPRPHSPRSANCQWPCRAATFRHVIIAEEHGRISADLLEACRGIFGGSSVQWQGTRMRRWPGMALLATIEEAFQAGFILAALLFETADDETISEHLARV
ncbi:predicted protein [Histoplasma capsulatum var. duboisii H88]|uniref:Predicted protein n=1 Tax=Ajellomyces capsulatus (strain H88) TaxID=544711 RepID=F0UHE7_AJEC8|nr:predicted protein [Histoplasma capsulatum var. duboisii H88]